MPHFTLNLPDGESLGAIQLAGHNWDVDDVIYTRVPASRTSSLLDGRTRQP
jgi:hypothetical protein